MGQLVEAESLIPRWSTAWRGVARQTSRELTQVTQTNKNTMKLSSTYMGKDIARQCITIKSLESLLIFNSNPTDQNRVVFEEFYKIKIKKTQVTK